MMNFKTSTYLLLGLLLSACSAEDIQNSPSKLDEKMKPFEYLNHARSFPDDYMDRDAYNKVAKEVAKKGASKNNDLPWTIEGPQNIGGRINCIAVDPQDDEVIYVGHSAGGVSKTINGGSSWEFIGNDFDFLSIGSIAIHPDSSNVLYVGTGDPNISGLPHPGNGVYKSVDGGETFEHLGLEDACIVSQIIIHPENTQHIVVGTMGLPFEENPNRGMYKSENGGNTWEQVLFVAEDAGIIDVISDPTDGDILYATSWNRIRNNSVSTIVGDDAHIYKSVDGGDNWGIMDNGLPEGDRGRMGLDISGQNPDRLVCLLVGLNSQIGGLFESNNGGETWSEILIEEPELSNALGGFGWYFGQVRLNPYDDQEITILGVDMFTSYDGGNDWSLTVPPWWTYEVHADKHDMVYLDNSTVLLATDGGLYKTVDHFDTWQDIEDIPNTQFYRVAVDPFNPGFYTGGAQDNGTTTGNLATIDDWNRDYGGDGFQAMFDYEDDDIRYAETQNGNFVFSDGFGWQAMNDGIDEADRTNWDTPIIMSTFSPNVLFTGTEKVYRMNFAPYGFWEPLSEDLTNGPVEEGPDNSISTVAESPLSVGLLYAGTTDGNVWRRMNSTSDWELISTDLPERYVKDIKTSNQNEAIVYVAHSGYKDNDNTPHIHMSEDYGDTWTDVSGDMPEQPVNHIEVYNDSIWCVATDFGVYLTSNAGVNWERVGNNMPMIPVYDIELDTFSNRIVAGTFARSLWTYPLDSVIFTPVVDTSDVDTTVTDTSTFVHERISRRNLVLFPNPVVEELRVKGISRNAEFTIYNPSGIKMQEGVIDQSADVIQVGELPAGMYYIRIIHPSGEELLRFVKY